MAWIGRNDPCPCGSGKKYKKCCLNTPALSNAGRDDRSFYAKRIQYCREFYTLFPAIDPSILLNMKRAEAESLFALGQVEDSEQTFAALTEEFPDSAWAYIGWGDMHCLFRPDERVPLDFDKGESI